MEVVSRATLPDRTQDHNLPNKQPARVELERAGVDSIELRSAGRAAGVHDRIRAEGVTGDRCTRNASSRP